MLTHRPVQAITTKYLSPTNVKGSRIKATAAAGSLTLHLDHALNIEANHAKAAEALANKLNWRGNWFMGGMPDDTGYCFVCTENFEALAFTTSCCAYHNSGGSRDLSCGGDRFTRSQ